MKKSIRIAALSSVLAIAALCMTGCASSGTGASTGSLEGSWTLTKVGDVYCYSNETSYNYTSLDCDWSTLTNRHSKTTGQAKEANGRWFSVTKGKVYCLVSPSAYNYDTKTCDFTNVK